MPIKRGRGELLGRIKDQKRPYKGGSEGPSIPSATKPNYKDKVNGNQKFLYQNYSKKGYYSSQYIKPKKVSKVDKGELQAKSKQEDR